MAAATQRHGWGGWPEISRAIPAGKTYVYEIRGQSAPGKPSMYHPHADEMVQNGPGPIEWASWVTHPRDAHPNIDEVDRDYVFYLTL